MKLNSLTKKQVMDVNKQIFLDSVFSLGALEEGRRYQVISLGRSAPLLTSRC
jgi:hypothetical protein